MTVPAALITAAILIAFSLLVVGRWEMVAGRSNGWAIRLDRWTGKIELCQPYSGSKTLACGDPD
jgi:hypothetical protein